jgi:thiamine-monophosphate kinase
MHIANASKVTMALESAAIKLPPKLDKDPLEYALYGGEDYALLMTSVRPLEGFVKIGTVEPMGEAAVTLDGQPIKTRGFDHFASTART